jgi:hypothetical protein
MEREMDKENQIEIGEVADIVNQMLADDKAKTDLYTEIDKAVECVFEPDPVIANLPFVQGRKFAMTDIADARNQGTRVFTSLPPDVKISPVTDNEGEYERVDKMEQAWKWEMEKMNRPSNGRKGVHDLIVESATTYHAVALQTEYLPFKFKGMKNEPRIKSLLNRRCFAWTVHHPGTVHAKYSDYGLEHVAKVSVYNALQLIENFGAGSEGAQKLLNDAHTDKKSELMRKKYTFVDYTNWRHRVQFAFPSSDASRVAPDNRIVFMNEPHGLDFINWVIVDYGDPLWQAVIQSGHWNNLQHMKLIKFSKAIAMAGKPDFAVFTPEGKMEGVWLDWKNPNNPLGARLGTQLQELSPNKLDPQFETEFQEDRQDVSRSTVARILGDPTPYVNAPFSTFNAAMTSAMGQLAPAKTAAETAEAEAIFQGYQWIKHSGIPFTSYRARTTDSKMDDGQPYMRGGQIIITPETPPTEDEFEKMGEKGLALMEKKVHFDLDQLYIKVELKSSNITDEQARMNTFINAIQNAGMSQKELWERMGWEGYEMNRVQRASEMLLDAEIQKTVSLKMLEVEQAKMQMQMQAQQQAEQQAMQAEQQAMQQQNAANRTAEMNAGSQFATMQGADLRGGGMAAAQVAPNENRVSIRGQADNGGQTL